MKKTVSLSCLFSLVFLFACLSARGEIKTQTVLYGPPSSPIEGFIAYDDARKQPAPGVLVIHEWWGLNDFIRGRTVELAKLGYVAFAADIYGKGVRAGSPEEAGKLAKKFLSDRKLLRNRARAALDELQKAPQVDKSRLAVIGFCFGGTAALELARSGADIKGVVSFHGNLETPSPQDAKNIKGSVLVLTGADDPSVPPKQVQAFIDEMREAGTDWYMVLYGNAVHSFTNPAHGTDPSKGVAYNEKADRRSWRVMQDFFGEIFRK